MTANLHALQERFEKLRSNKLFETFVIHVIVISALMIGAKTYPLSSTAAQVIWALDLGITLFFLAEIIIRMEAMLQQQRTIQNQSEVP
jgi:voltage-gated sodium channel